MYVYVSLKSFCKVKKKLLFQQIFTVEKERNDCHNEKNHYLCIIITKHKHEQTD